MADPLAVIRSERRALIAYLETLTAEEWATPSLCGRWTVQEVAAHVAWAPVQSPAEAMSYLRRSGLRPNRANADSAVGWARRGTAAILDQLRANVTNDAKPIGVPRAAALVDAVVHASDIRRPLGRTRVIPQDAFTPAADFCARTRWPASVMVGGNVQRRIRGLRLVADDVTWSWGDGPEVHGPGEALLLMLTGRPVGRGELTGAGAAQLSARLSAVHDRQR
jgi:uncharacterized protein (TIGR03083 family)